MNRAIAFYILTIAVFGGGIYAALQYGKTLESARGSGGLEPAPTVVEPTHSQPTTNPATGQDWISGQFGSQLRNLRHPLAILFLQVVTVIIAARLCGRLFRRIGQPAVIGEIVAGIVLGPSLLGSLAPDAFAYLFPSSAMTTLQLLSQVGVVLFMFAVGLDFDTEHLRHRAQSAVIVSHASIIFPYFLGVVTALLIYRRFAPAGVTFQAFSLFMGIAMSITAFPVLARILEERGMTRTELGSMALTCSAVGDVTAWGLLAIIVALAKSDRMGGALLTVVLSLAFVGFMLLVIRPWLAKLVRIDVERLEPRKGILALVLVFVLGSALCTEVIGIHALFGAFLAGVTIPNEPRLRAILRERLEMVSSVLLLPLFFAFTGLRTQLGLMNDAGDWLWCGAIIAIATLGKLGGSMAAARWSRMSWHDSFVVGALMNTRGLMELIALNIGYDLGILSPRIFTMLALMAVVTTILTGPLLGIAHIARRRTETVAGAAII